MRIRVNQSVAGVDCSFTPGEYDVGPGKREISEALAHEFLTCGIADMVLRDPVEVAEVKAPEVAITRGRSRARGRGNRPQPDAG